MAAPITENKSNTTANETRSKEETQSDIKSERRYQEPQNRALDEEDHALQSGGQKGGLQQGQRGAGKTLGDDDRSKGGVWEHSKGRKAG